MKVRNFEHHINWEDTWKKMRKERMRKPDISYDNNFFKKSAEDFSRRIKLNDYEFGRKAVELLNKIMEDSFEVLEIGTGPGTLTIPLSRIVRRVVGIEFSEMNIRYLKENLKEDNQKNVEIVNENWEKINDDEIKDKFDLVVCSHFLWQIENIKELLKRMENSSKKYCAILQPCGRDEIVKEAFEEVCNQKYSGQFEPDADYFTYVILREWGRLASVRYFDYVLEQNLEEKTRYVSGLVGRYIEVNQSVKKRIRDYLLSKSENGKYVEKNKAVVMWWKPVK
jgi:SAM-dependent methyltransferase